MKSWRVLLSGIAVSLTLATAARADITAGLVSYWPLDEIDGTTTPDYALTNVATIRGNPTIVTGKFTNAFSFPSTPVSYFSTAFAATPPTSLPIYKSPYGYTVAMWVKGAPPTATRYLYSDSSTNNANPIFAIETGTSATTFSNAAILIRADGGGTLINNVASKSVVFDNTWHHIAWTDYKGTCALYVDGQLDATTYHYTPSGTFTLNASTVANLIRTTVAAAFVGTIDDVGVWQRPLSQAEIQQFMTNGLQLPIVPSMPAVSSITPDSTVALGDYVTLNINAAGSFPITYQWYLDGALLENQTSNTLPVTTLTVPRTNIFSVVTANYLGSISNNIAIVVSPDPANNFTNGLISYWPLDTVTNTSVTTNSPDLYSHNDFLLAGTNSSAPVSTSGEFGNALAFDATQLQYGRALGGVPVFNYTNYTVSLWVNGQPGAQLRVFAESSTNSATPLFTIATDPTAFLPGASIYVRNDANTVFVNNLTSSLTAFDGTWHHIVWVDQNGHALLYIDGVLDPVSFSYARTGTFSLNTTAIAAIVRSTVGNYFAGNIDDVAMWSRRLTYSEITALQTTTLSAPTQILPPKITAFSVTPIDPTNNLYAGDALTFTTQVAGTAPIAYQWLKDGQPISAAVNATANSSTLVIASAQPADSGAYSLSVSNGDPTLPGGGVVISSPVQANVQAWTAVTNGLALDLDVDALGFPNTQPGFQEYDSSKAGVSFTNALKVTISAFATSAALTDRLRTTAPYAVFNGPTMTQAQLYNDFLYCNSTVPGTGLNILLERLAPNTQYGVTIWSFDPSSLNPRTSDWKELSSGTPIVIKTGYSFDGNVLPTSDYDDTLGALLTSSATGKLQIQATNTISGTPNLAVFINAIQLVANPVISIAKAGMNADGNFQIVVQGKYPGQPITLQSSVSLNPANWQPVNNSVITASHGPMVTMEIPLTTNQLFFRAQGN